MNKVTLDKHLRRLHGRGKIKVFLPVSLQREDLLAFKEPKGKELAIEFVTAGGFSYIFENNEADGVGVSYQTLRRQEKTIYAKLDDGPAIIDFMDNMPSKAMLCQGISGAVLTNCQLQLDLLGEQLQCQLNYDLDYRVECSASDIKLTFWQQTQAEFRREARVLSLQICRKKIPCRTLSILCGNHQREFNLLSTAAKPLFASNCQVMITPVHQVSANEYICLARPLLAAFIDDYAKLSKRVFSETDGKKDDFELIHPPKNSAVWRTKQNLREFIGSIVEEGLVYEGQRITFSQPLGGETSIFSNQPLYVRWGNMVISEYQGA